MSKREKPWRKSTDRMHSGSSNCGRTADGLRTDCGRTADGRRTDCGRTADGQRTDSGLCSILQGNYGCITETFICGWGFWECSHGLNFEGSTLRLYIHSFVPKSSLSTFLCGTCPFLQISQLPFVPPVPGTRSSLPFVAPVCHSRLSLPFAAPVRRTAEARRTLLYTTGELWLHNWNFYMWVRFLRMLSRPKFWRFNSKIVHTFVCP